MLALNKATWRAAVAGRWTARIVGTLIALVLLTLLGLMGFMALLEGPFAVLGIPALLLGPLLAWKWERSGGLAMLAGVVLSMGMTWGLLTAWELSVLAAVGVLHFLCGWRIASGPLADRDAWPVPRAVRGIAGALVATFILLCANELLGDPPLMTPALHPSPEMTGRWSADPGDPNFENFLISPDAQVSWRAGDRSFTGGRIRNNRSWFGTFMRWRSPYRISGPGFSAKITIRRREMDASISYGGSLPGWDLILLKQ